MAELEPRIIQDPVWGETVIHEPVLLELLDSATVKRLKGINQLGLPDRYHHLKGYNRLDHSIGAMVLIRRLGGGLDEQAAGLLHDSSHTAFSHMIDWVMGSQATADYQDLNHTDFLKQSEIPGILQKHGFNVDQVTDYHNFSLLEQEMPLLCADRVDYGLREMLVSGFAPEVVPDCVASLTTFGGRMVFSDFEAARSFGYGFKSLQAGDWGSRGSVLRYRIFADVLRDGLNEGAINMEDFYNEDEFVISKLLIKGSDKVTAGLGGLRRPLDEILADNKFKGTRVSHKFRYVDPEILIDGQLVRLMDLDPIYKQEVAHDREINDLGIIL